MSAFQPQRVGEVRLGQALHTYGVGSIADLPHLSVMTSGLQQWRVPTPLDAINEDRLLGIVRNHLGRQVERLCRPPVADFSGNPFDPQAQIGVPVVPFPRWVRCPRCHLLAPLDYGVFQLKPEPFRVDKTRHVHGNCPGPGGPPTVVPARFVVACQNGHIDDFPWQEFVGHTSSTCRGPLTFYEQGLSSEVANLWVKCLACGATKPMSQAFGEDGEKNLPRCTGRHPHLGLDVQEDCTLRPRAMLVGASNIWFPMLVSALSLPISVDELRQRIDENWNALGQIQSESELPVMRRVGVLQPLARWGDAEIWEGIESRRREEAGEEGPRKVSELKSEEWEVFSDPDSAPTVKDFEVESTDPPMGFEAWFEETVLVRRLRVVRALTGFTRISSPGDFGDLSEIPDVQRAPLTRTAPTWVPAHEIRGEGIFLRILEEPLQAWESRADVRALDRRFQGAHRGFRETRNIPAPDQGYPGIRYVLLHSLAHALIRQLAIECGYSSASVAERIYSAAPGEEGGPMAGILLYTAAADSEGTLGGLVALGEPAALARHLEMALERLGFCASDPLCSEHRPETERGVLHGASCHACGFVSETSCERGNKYLDRAVLVDTVSGSVHPFFHGRASR